MNDHLNKNLLACSGHKLDSIETEGDRALIQFTIPGVARFWGSYWRFIRANKPLLCWLDHNQKYGLPKPIDASTQLIDYLKFATIDIFEANLFTGDLTLKFRDGGRLEVFNFSGTEVWELNFENGDFYVSSDFLVTENEPFTR